MSSRGNPTGIFWDIEDCMIPDELNVGQVKQRMKESLSSIGVDGSTVSIRAYGCNDKDHDFLSAGISFHPFPHGHRYARHTKMLEDIASWAMETPAPANLMLIIGDTSQDFEDMVVLLKSRNYTFLLAHP